METKENFENEQFDDELGGLITRMLYTVKPVDGVDIEPIHAVRTEQEPDPAKMDKVFQNVLAQLKDKKEKA